MPVHPRNYDAKTDTFGFLPAGDDPLDVANLTNQFQISGGTFTQPKITGYRQLNADEAAMMNEAKALGAAAEELVGRLRRYHQLQFDEAVASADVAGARRIDDAQPGRWLAMGRTDIQVGIMKIVRSIAQPAS